MCFKIGTANFLVVKEADARGRRNLTLRSVVLNMQLSLVSLNLQPPYVYSYFISAGASYCLYPECTVKSHDNFCSERHLEKAKREGNYMLYYGFVKKSFAFRCLWTGNSGQCEWAV